MENIAPELVVVLDMSMLVSIVGQTPIAEVILFGIIMEQPVLELLRILAQAILPALPLLPQKVFALKIGLYQV